MRARVALGGLAVAAAAVAAALDLPGPIVRGYGASLYPWLQAHLTPLSNRTTVPLFDALLAAVAAGAIVGLAVAIGRVRRRRKAGPLVRWFGVTVTIAALLYLWFVGAWGFNYRRPGVEATLPAFSPGRATPDAVLALAERAVATANRLHGDAHAQGFPALDAVPGTLVDSLHAVERRLGRSTPTVPSRPKVPLTAPYMRAVGVSGMLAPFFLETYLNPDLTGPERPYVLAHEWAHLAGYAAEADANFVAWLATMEARTRPETRYSGWLFLVMETAAQVPRAARRASLEKLGEGPRRDLDAIAARARQRVDVVQRVGWRVYDRYLRSQGVHDGVVSYSRVVDLIARASRDRGGARVPMPQ
jgi:hypothetical protein